MASNPKLLRLLERLVEATTQGTIDWEETALEGQYRTVLDRSMIRIGREADQADGGPYYSFTLMDLRAVIFENIEIRNGKEFQILDSLYCLARSRAEDDQGFLDVVIADVDARKS